jgi:hypothetical protein
LPYHFIRNHLPQLSDFTIARNDLKGTGALAIFDALSLRQRELQHLRLEGNDIGRFRGTSASAWKALANLIGRNGKHSLPLLETLDLSRNSISGLDGKVCALSAF